LITARVEDVNIILEFHLLFLPLLPRFMAVGLTTAPGRDSAPPPRLPVLQQIADPLLLLLRYLLAKRLFDFTGVIVFLFGFAEEAYARISHGLTIESAAHIPLSQIIFVLLCYADLLLNL